MHSPLWIAGICATLALLASPGTHAGLTYDLRIVGGQDPKVAQVVNVGDQVTMDLWAVVTGSGAGAEGFSFGYGSLLSSFGGNVKGSLQSTLLAPFDTIGGSQQGTQVDLDGDGDLDIGSQATAQNTDFFKARAGGTVESGIPILDGVEFKLATVKFTVTEIGSTLFTAILLNFRVTDFLSPLENEALWEQDGLPMQANGGGTLPTVGTDVSIVLIPEPSSLLLLGSGLGCLALRRRRR